MGGEHTLLAPAAITVHELGHILVAMLLGILLVQVRYVEIRLVIVNQRVIPLTTIIVVGILVVMLILAVIPEGLFIVAAANRFVGC
jgi:hypothetical protein